MYYMHQKYQIYPIGKTNFPPNSVLFTSEENSIFITREFQRHRDAEKPNFLSVCYRKKKIESRV